MTDTCQKWGGLVKIYFELRLLITNSITDYNTAENSESLISYESTKVEGS